MENPITATFRIERDTWNEFQDYAKGKGQTASAAIKKFIDLCLSGGLDEDSVLAATLNPPEIDPDVEKAIANAIKPLEARIQSLEARLS